ncbi:hypothetical protein Hanom_Chr12g01103691 [Helianthus anomalus]
MILFSLLIFLAKFIAELLTCFSLRISAFTASIVAIVSRAFLSAASFACYYYLQ